MDSIPQLLARFQEKGITLSLSEGALKFKARAGAITEEDRAQLTAAKAGIVDYFVAQKAAAFPPLEKTKRPHVPAHIQSAWWAWIRHSPIQLPHERLAVALEIADTTPARIQSVLRDTLARYRTLTTRFFEQDGELALDYNSPSDFLLESETLPGTAGKDDAWARARDFVGRTLPVDSEWLVRANAIFLPSGDILLALAIHHILADGYTIELLHAELEAALSGGAAPDEKGVQFTDYAAMERRWWGRAGPALVAYWKKWLAGQEPLRLEGRPLQWEDAGGNTNNAFVLEAPVVNVMEGVAQKLNLSAFIVYLTVFAISLSKWTGQRRFPLRCIGNLRGTHAPFSVAGNLVCADPVSVSVPDEPDFAALSRSIGREYYNSVSLRLPSLLNFPAHHAYPGLEHEKFTNTIAATMNFSPGNAYASKAPVRRLDATPQTMNWPPKVERSPPQKWPALLWPINFRLSEMGPQISGLVQFNEDIVAPARQDQLLAIFFEEIAALTGDWLRTS